MAFSEERGPAAPAERAGDRTRYAVVVNGEGQYSLWPDALPFPPGWHEAGVRGDEDACLDAIAERWTDLCPLSLRREPAPAVDRA